ncbi:MAG TPA: pyridoxamine 5'-phosphate oxidase family protein [Intrasporangium sp.]|uniref:pyridoxamine 5'-phosphate oxidase family protein n=1 Tax=Intrasporangium sp. TaxID=1925024 RepID=UPI002D778F99|nr:pyridoxamine 5'-phosphate oxidase family protein [Intrasporangium sp.]HET7400024.1 pyridoxamine 5'-phosphate oxidase family protein [Intrasporangium sp.]
MRETPEEVVALQDLLDRSHARATEHLRAIITAERRLTAEDVVALMTGMKVLSLATVTASGEPRISAVDGHFLHGTWTFSTSGSAAKARHLRQRPAVSVAHVDNEELALFSHGRAEELRAGDPAHEEMVAHWTAHYGQSPLEFGPDVRLYRLRAEWMVGYAWQRAELLRSRHVTA